MSDRLDRVEMLLESHGLAMAELRTRQEVTSNHLDRIDNALDRLTEQSSQLNIKIDLTNTLIVDLANVVYTMANRQDDHESRINRLEP